MAETNVTTLPVAPQPKTAIAEFDRNATSSDHLNRILNWRMRHAPELGFSLLELEAVASGNRKGIVYDFALNLLELNTESEFPEFEFNLPLMFHWWVSLASALLTGDLCESHWECAPGFVTHRDALIKKEQEFYVALSKFRAESLQFEVYGEYDPDDCAGAVLELLAQYAAYRQAVCDLAAFRNRDLFLSIGSYV